MAYAARSDIESEFGVNEVAKWADLDNDGNTTSITNRITARLADAEDAVDNALRGGAYTVPFATVPTTITRATAILAGVMLFESRGHATDDQDDMNFPRHRLAQLEAYARRVLACIRAGITTLDPGTWPKKLDIPATYSQSLPT